MRSIPHPPLPHPRGSGSVAASRLQRRTLLSALLALLLLLSASLPAAERYEASANIMGSEMRIALYGEKRGVLASAALSAFDEARRIDRLISNYRDDSEWSRINREAARGPVPISAESADLIARCLDYSRASDGAFDITVGKLMKVWGFYKGSGELPWRWEISRARKQVGYRGIELDRAGSTIRFTNRALELDPGGIGKGYAVQKVAELLSGYGIAAAMISAGASSMYAIGAPPEEPRGWKVNVQAPRGGPPAAAVYLRDGSMSTSGSYERFFEAEGAIYSHLIDPRTGMPAQGAAQVTVLAPSALDSEAWTTALFVNGLEWATPRAGELPPTLYCPIDAACRWLGPKPKQAAP